MKIFYFTICITLFVLSELKPQIKSFEITGSSAGLDIQLQFQREPFEVISGNGKNIAEYRNHFDESRPGAPALPSKIIFVAIPPKSKISAVLKNIKGNYIQDVLIKVNPVVVPEGDERIKYKEAEPDLRYFVTDKYPAADLEIIGYTWIRDYYCAVIKINTHSYNWKKKEITEIFSAELSINFIEQKPFLLNTSPHGLIDQELADVIINYKTASGFRSFQLNYAPDDTSGNWIDFSKEYVKLAIPEDGIYRIYYDDLQSYGINVSQVNPVTFKIFRNGVQIPIYVKGENDFSFEAGDYIEFWMTKNYSTDNYRTIVNFGEDYINYLNRYNDTSFIWLTWEGEPGLRADSLTTFTPGLTDTLKSGLVKLHLEKDVRLWYYDAVAVNVQLPFWQENKIWSWEFLGGSGNRAFNFTASHFIPETEVKTIARMKSHAGDITINTHKYGASLNSGTPQDTIVFNYRQTVNFSSVFNSNSLIQGNNVYRIFGLPTQATVNQSVIDWIDIEYFRYNVAVNDSITIIVPDSVQSDLKIVKVENLVSPEFLVYKISPQFKRITSYNITDGILYFTDTLSGGDKYFIINENYLKSPDFRIKKQFTNLRDPQHSADYIIISNKELLQGAEEYKDFISTEYDMRVETLYIDDIYDEFAFGLNDAEAVQKFLKAAYFNWQAPAPSYLNLIGDANYDYKNVIVPPTGIIRKNLVPAFGHPVSDSWFVMWDSSNINIPQMYVGRIPAVRNEDIQFYIQKHLAYINRNFDEWNKEFLFFSGGDIANQTQLNQIKQANDNVFSNLVKPAPVGGSGVHFYKTTNPPTNLGPYTLAEIREAIGKGGLFISYIGHSGTQTWDNGITSTGDLKINYPDRHPLISDFGCSTGKFAEPDYESFGELFIVEIPDGHAINYLGNSSWGYLTTSLRFPSLFYSKLLIDTVTETGKAHWLAKVQQFNDYGFSDLNRVFNYCNLLFGDPVVGFKTPLKPNFTVHEGSFSVLTENINDMTDSVQIAIEIFNTGRVPEDSVDINIVNTWLGTNIFEADLRIPSPLYRDTLKIYIPILRRVGQHTVNVILDKDNLIEEIYEDDNSASFNFYAYSTSARPIEVEKYYTGRRLKLDVLNPTILSPDLPEELLFSVSDNTEFINPVNFVRNFDTVFTSLSLGSLTPDKRYWWRVKINLQDQEWSDIYSFENINNDFSWYINDSFNNEDVEYFNSKFDSSSSSWILTTDENVIEVGSAGSDDGEYGSMIYNGQEMLPNTFYWGIATAEIDTVTLKPSNFREFLYWDGNADELMMAYLDSLPIGKVVAMTICADGAQSVLGFSGGTAIRQTIEGWGSLYVDSVRYRDSWCIIGKKGAAPGTVPEAFNRRFFGPVEVSVSNIVNNTIGSVVFPVAGKSAEWINIEKQDFLPPGTSVEYFPIGIKKNSEADTLDALNFTNNTASLEHIDVSLYRYIKIFAQLNSNELFESPGINSLGINFTIPPDLAINYQVVKINSDTVDMGDDVKLDFMVFNPTKTPADSFKVLVELLDDNNFIITSAENTVNDLAPLSSRSFSEVINTLYLSHNYTFRITIDPENSVDEFFEDNNFFSIPFYVRPDTSVPSLNITFDGEDIFDGDYISADPEIRIELFDPSLLPVNDTSSVTIFLNDEPVYYALNPRILSYEFNSTNPKVVVNFTPHLTTGEYRLKVFGKNTIGNLADSSGLEKYFIVDEETKLLDVYNYPNPFSAETNFTFRLTQIPDELKIRIYTVAGRLIREIEKSFSDLDYNFNIIPWNGKDHDKNDIANGIYFYKVIMIKDGVSQTVTQKLAKVR
jgi:hypothetical protein